MAGYRIDNFLSNLFGIRLLGSVSQRSLSGAAYDQVWLLLTGIALLTLVSFCVRLARQVSNVAK
jgi:hypothetical protein